MENSARDLFFKILITATLLTAVLAFALWDRALTLGLEKLTGWDISYSRWTGNPLGRSVVDSPEFLVKELGGGLSAGRLALSVDPSRLLPDRRISVECIMRDVRLFIYPGVDGDAKTILELVASSDGAFGETFFLLTVGLDILEVTSLEAGSDDFKIRGNFSWKRGEGTVSVELDISVSPEAAAGLAEGVKSRVLSLQEDGWYGTSINFRGDPTFLKALYFTFSPART